MLMNPFHIRNAQFLSLVYFAPNKINRNQTILCGKDSFKSCEFCIQRIISPVRIPGHILIRFLFF